MCVCVSVCTHMCMHINDGALKDLWMICTSLNVLDDQDSCLFAFPYSEPSAQSPSLRALEIQVKDHRLREAPLDHHSPLPRVPS